MSDEAPLTPAQLEGIGRAQAARAPNAMTRVYDPDSKSIIDVPTTEIKGYVDAGFKTGPEADLAMEEDGTLGQMASAALGVARGASLGLSDFAVPQSLRTLQEQVDALHPVTKIAGEMAGSLASLGASGAAGAAAAARAGAPQFAELAAAAGRVAQGATEGGNRAIFDSQRNNDPLTAERFLQGVGMGALINMGGEGAAHVLGKAVPAFQRSTARFLEGAAEKGYLRKLAGQSMDAFGGGLDEALPAAEEASKLGDEARAAFGGMREMPPPLPQRAVRAPQQALEDSAIPGAKAELLETRKPGPTFDDATQQRLTGDVPMSQAESRAAYDSLDREAADAARMGEHEGMEGVAQDLRDQRDYFSKNRGLSDSELTDWSAKRAALTAPDAEIDGAFDRAGFNGGGEQVSGGLTELPLPEELAQGAESPQPQAKFPRQRAARPPTLRQSVKAENASLPPDMSLPTDLPYHAPLSESFPQSRYEMTGDRGILKNIFPKTALYGALHTIPFGIGPALSGTYAASQAALYAARKATVFALNHQNALNTIVDRVMAPAVKMTGRTVKTLLQGNSAELSSAFLQGDVDAEYKHITQGANSVASDPEALEQYYQGRYGEMLRDQQEMYGNIVAQSAKQHTFVAAQIPKDPRQYVGMIDGEYDPPRSEKLKVIEAYKAVNDPYSVLAAPTLSGVQAVAQTHPETLKLIQQLLFAQISDPKVAKKLTPEQTQAISIVLQAPVTGADTPDFIAGLQQTAQGMSSSGSSGPAPGGTPAGKTVNLGGQAGQFASAIAPPSQQHDLDSTQ